MALPKINKEDSSFRDPSGFIFYYDHQIYRQINLICKEDYELLHSSGLYERITKKKKLVSHQEVDNPIPNPDCAYKIIKPEKIEFLSYPYEWSFSQLKDAALLTLNIQKEALLSGMTLKDASAYNIQFKDGHPILIDTLSFTIYHEGQPWVAYKQFCQHFLSPLALMSLTDIRLNGMLKNHIDGIPLDLTSKMLPKSSWVNFGLLSHIHLHARAQKNISSDDAEKNKPKTKLSKTAFIGLIENLEKTIKKLKWEPHGTDWLAYYQATNYSDAAFEKKKEIVHQILSELNPKSVLDLGANTGVFSREGKNLQDCFIVSTDIDPGAVELNYLEVKRAKEKNILPLVLDLTNPSPSIGWKNQERVSFLSRAHVDVTMALALIHHLAIANNIPLRNIAKTLSEMADNVIIEFVPKEDSQVKRLLLTRDDIFDQYTIDGFVVAMQTEFTIVKQFPIENSDRVIFQLKKKNS
ncbi:MAG: SAM-dependent methyltransferase [Anaerolineaceae bacterium]|nr:SAM-dependent methyltransferase [Anaerolineaceae bacterium]